MTLINIYDNCNKNSEFHVLTEIFENYPIDDIFITKRNEITDLNEWNLKAILKFSLNSLNLQYFDLILLNIQFSN